MRYCPERKEAVLKKMMAPHNRSLRELATEDISEATLYNWRKQARSKGLLMPDGDSGPEGWSARDKFAAVMESAALKDQQTAEYCRRKGLYPHRLEQWRQACEAANDWDRHSTLKLKAEQKTSRQRTKALEKELQRKEKALAEAAVLLVLQKKCRRSGGSPRTNDQRP
jgi:transposase-like protein